MNDDSAGAAVFHNRRFGIVLAHLGGGGAEPVLAQWADMVRRHGGWVCFLTTHQADPPDAAEGIRVVPVPRVGRVPVLDVALGIRDVVRTEGIDTVITALANPNLTATLAQLADRHRFNLVLSQHDVATEIVKVQGTAERLQWQLGKRVLRRADAVVAVSHAVAANLLAECHITPDRLHVVPNVCLADDAEVVVARPPALGHGTLTLVVPSRQVSFKRPELAIEVAEILNRTVPTRVEFFGQGPARAALEARAAGSAVDVVLHGHVPHWEQHVPADGICFLPSVTEGFGIVFVEAASRSVPSVASSRAIGVSDAILPGITGELCREDTAEAFAAAALRAAAMTLPDVGPWLDRFRRSSVEACFLPIIASLPAKRAHA